MTASVQVGTVTVRGPNTPSFHVNWPDLQVVIGEQPVWSDADDSTYAELHGISQQGDHEGPDSFLALDFAEARIVRVEGDGSDNMLAWSVRLAVVDMGGYPSDEWGATIEFFSGNPALGEPLLGYVSADMRMPADGTVVDASGVIDLVAQGTSWAEISSYIDAGTYEAEVAPYSSIGTLPTFDYIVTVRVYEVGLGPVRGIPRRRMTGRNDGTRRWPRPSSVQASGRRGPGAQV